MCPLTKRNYGLLPEKEAESELWEKLCIDLIGPYPIPTKGHKKTKDSTPLQLWAMAMIDPATGWIEIKEITTKHADFFANVVLEKHGLRGILDQV